MTLRALVVTLAACIGLALVRPVDAATPTSTGDALYASAAPAIAFIDTPIATGSGIYFEGGYVLTDAHVVWPYDTVRVRFPDGRIFRDAPVVAEDSLADLAVIRVGDVPGITPLRFADPARVDNGSDIFAIGYPAERDANPLPTVSRGLLSRIRQGGPLRLQYVQTDAATAPGASGGALLTASGEVIGIIQLRFPSTNFTLALSGAQAIERMRAQLNAPGELGRRQYTSIAGTPMASDRVQLATRYEQRAYLVRTLTGVDVTVTADSPDAVLTVYDPTGDRVARSTSTDQRATVTFSSLANAPFALTVTSPKASSFTVSSDYPIARIADPDDGRALTRDASVMGSFDFYGDVDVYTLDLREGQTVAVTAESTLANPVLLVARADGSSTATLDSTSTPIERGLLGNDAVLLFTASADRHYFIVVTDYSLLSAPQHGAYRLSVFSSQPARSTKGFGTITSGDRPGQAAGAFVFGGGSDEDLLTATGCSRAGLRVWASRPDGSFVTFVPGATVAQANAAWTEAFPFGIPVATALVGQCLR